MKKFLAILLTAMLVLSMTAVAFADDDPITPPSITIGDNTYTDITSVTIEKVYKIQNAGTTSPAETFTVEQIGDGIVTDGDATSAPALGTITGASFAEGAATQEGAKANITISLPTYSTVGVYEYTLYETVGNTAGVVYRSDSIKLVVTVMQGDDGKVRVAAVHTEGESGDKTGSIENVYQAAGVQSENTGLRIQKTVSGNMADHDKYFEFTVTLTGEQGKTYASSGYAVKGGSDSRNPASVTVGSTFKIYLKADETITIENLPYGVTYTVDETAYEDYDTTGEVLEAATVDNATESVTVNNSKGASIDTGITTDTLPYVLLMGIVLLAGAAMIIKRRAHNN